MPSTRDTSIRVPAPELRHTRPLPFERAPLRRNADADGIDLLRGQNACASVTAAHTQRLRFGAGDTLHYLHLMGAQPHTREITSVGTASDHIIDDVICSERLCVSPNEPAFIAEWTTTAPTDVMLSWASIAGTHDMRWNTHGATLVVAAANAYTCVTIAPPESVRDAAWTVHDNTSNGVTRITARITLSLGAEPVKLYATSARSVDETADLLKRIADAPSRMLSQIASQRRRETQEISIVTPQPPLDAALAWAKQVIPLRVEHTDIDRFFHGLAALACGDPATARHSIIAYDAPDAAFLILLARYHALTGDGAFLAKQWPRVQTAADTATIALDQTINISAAAAIAATAGDIGQSVYSADLQTRVKRARIERASQLRDTHWLDDLDHPAARAWLAFEQQHTDSATDALIRHAPYTETDPAPFVVPLFMGMLGIEPDAARNRLRIRPQLPAHWDTATIERIRIGDALVSLDYRREPTASGMLHRFTAEQTTGAVPVRLILEPVLAGTAVVAAAVDGTPAALVPRPFGTRILVPVQVVLDETRMIDIVTIQPDGPSAGTRQADDER